MALPDGGGTIGRAYDCTLQLPDFDRQLSRIHAEISRDPRGGYQVTDRSTNGLRVNGRLLGRGRHQRLGDGDILRLGGYSLLVSDLSSLLNARPAPADEGPAQPQGPVFDLDNLDATDSAWPLDDAEAGAFEPEPDSDFSRHNVMADDPFGPDPFEDDCELPLPEKPARADVVTLDQAPSTGESRALHASLQALTRLLEQQQHQAVAPWGRSG
ncbi:FHA domain-containing protein [Marinobacterium aestuariivivens]|uniref:FHA domain-containing protein n=1 Tax=Marinobacterium aestuariivivens TaxID=1698799 RepID=A0ABW1ZZU2_9GAMM